MKFFTLTICFFLFNSLFAQKTLDVKLILKYRNNPLCNWDVTIKHGDVMIAKSKSNEKGEVEFKSAKLLSLSIDAYGYKSFQGGDKKWDVKGYIKLDDQGFAVFDFESIVKEVGMPVSMLEAAWGLTINDCGQIAGSTKNEEKSATAVGKTEESKPKEEEEEKYSIQDMQQDMKQGIDNSKAMYENKISNLTSKIDKKTKQRMALDPKSKEYSDISYEIRDLEVEREITKIKLEKVNIQIAKGYKPFIKSEKEPFEAREEVFDVEQKALKKQQKEGYFYGTSDLIENTSSKQKEELKPAKEKPEREKIEKNSELKQDEITDEVVERKFYTSSELAEMSVFNLKKYKMECNALKVKTELNLKTKSSLYTPKEIEQYKANLVDIENQIVLIENELKKRSDAKE